MPLSTWLTDTSFIDLHRGKTIAIGDRSGFLGEASVVSPFHEETSPAHAALQSGEVVWVVAALSEDSAQKVLALEKRHLTTLSEVVAWDMEADLPPSTSSLVFCGDELGFTRAVVSIATPSKKKT